MKQLREFKFKSFFEENKKSLKGTKNMNKYDICLGSLYQIEKVTTQPKYPNDLPLDTMWLICHAVQSCDYGKCDDCKRNCQIQQFRHKLNVLKPSFCPGDYRRCERSRVLKGCGKCRSKNLDLNIKASEKAYPPEKLKDPELQPQIEELEMLANRV